MNVETDLVLLEAWRRGDEAAGERLVIRHFPTVYRFFRRKIDRDADDLTQKTFLALLRASPTAACRDFKCYLLGIARHVLMHEFRDERRRVDREERAALAPDEPMSASVVIAMRQEQRLLLRALRRLPLDLQITVELHYWESMTSSQIAMVLDVAPGTVKWRLSRARELISAHVEELAVSAALQQSTMASFESWISAMRARV